VAGRWLLRLGSATALLLGALLAAAGAPLVGLFLAAVVFLAARSAVDPRERVAQAEALRERCNRLPFCDCS
jgi:hypothetical protein